MRNNKPLAYRMAPESLDDFVGQEHILGKGKLLRRMIEADQINSIILFGPPGTGKTSIARIIANETSSNFKRINAVTAGIKDIKEIVDESKNYLLNPSGRMLIFVDEIHRFNKAQQDALLPHVEDGTLILIGATTENPYFEVNKALLSRSTVFQLYPLTASNVKTIVQNALDKLQEQDPSLTINIDPEALDSLANVSNGDARSALNAIELAYKTTDTDSDNNLFITKEIIEDCVQKKTLLYDKDGEEHYDTISAFIKSMRGSDPDAAVFYLARMLEAGEDLDFICRRIVICAAEDVGLANPQILSICVSAWEAVSRIGMPEARIILSEAVIAVATSPKSNRAYNAINSALADVRTGNTGEIPFAVRNAPIDEMQSNLGYSNGYKYAHDYPYSIAEMEFLPEKLKGKVYYEPTQNGYEKTINERLNFIKQRLGRNKNTSSNNKSAYADKE